MIPWMTYFGTNHGRDATRGRNFKDMADRLRFATNVPLQDQSPIYKQRGYGVMQPIYTSYQSSSPSLE